jgi:phosphoribosylamine--glycine ligase
MKILIIGSGGREHALAWQIAQFDHHVVVAPGNGGTALADNIQNVAIEATNIKALVDYAKTEHIELTIVGPEAPLAAGIVNAFAAEKLAIFGPTQQAAQLESSKAFSKNFMQRHAIPTAFYQTFTEIEPAKAYITQQGAPIVVKADGLAAGKGVIVARTEAEARQAVEDMLSGNQFGDAGHRVVIEEFLAGTEASFIVMCDGQHILPMATSQDHKARDDGDQGPNTGGMGAYSPAPVVTEALHQQIMTEIIVPTIAGMQADGIEYTGFLYAGIMLTEHGPKVLEYNCRFGDPETQPIMLRLKTDLAKLCLAATQQQLHTVTAEWDDRFALGVVMASRNYPEDYPKGDMIEGLNTIKNSMVFHAGTILNNDTLTTNGGRVLCVTALGDSVQQAQQHAYENVQRIHWGCEFYRSDIGTKAL